MQTLPHALFTASQLKVLDRLIVEREAISGYELMLRAGESGFTHLLKCWPNAKSFLIFCGVGNNAGDGYVIARLAQTAGFAVQVVAIGKPEQLTPDATLAYQAFVQAKGHIQQFSPSLVISADVIIDAIFGTGVNRAITGSFAEAIDAINHSEIPVMAVDIPSGLNADTGTIMAIAVRAESTHTFIGLKQGMFTGEAGDYCGEISFDALTELPDLYDEIKSNTFRVQRKQLPKRPSNSHKGMYGHTLIVGGSPGFSGAAMLAGEAALRMGSGLVSIATDSRHANLLNLHRPELMCHGVTSAEQVLELCAKASVIVLGPGLGQSEWAQMLFDTIVSLNKPILIDADGLNLLAKAPQKRGNWILTPHPGEAARLLKINTANIQQDRFTAAQRIQTQFGGVVVLKGRGTLIANQDTIAISTTGNPGMASGGMGDVLAGAIAGLLAQGEGLMEAACQGCFGHGWAADEAVRIDGEKGLLASDLMPHLRHWLNLAQ